MARSSIDSSRLTNEMNGAIASFCLFATSGAMRRSPAMSSPRTAEEEIRERDAPAGRAA